MQADTLEQNQTTGQRGSGHTTYALGRTMQKQTHVEKETREKGAGGAYPKPTQRLVSTSSNEQKTWELNAEEWGAGPNVGMENAQSMKLWSHKRFPARQNQRNNQTRQTCVRKHCTRQHPQPTIQATPLRNTGAQQFERQNALHCPRVGRCRSTSICTDLRKSRKIHLALRSSV